MSLRKKLFGSVLIFSFLGVLSVSYLLLNNPKNTTNFRVPFLQSKFTSKGVVNRVIQLKLTSTDAKYNSEKVEINADISLPFDFNDTLYYRWKLGQDVILTDGVLSGQVSNLFKNEAKKLTLFVTGFSKENNHQIGFEIYGIKNGKNIFGDALIASDIENTFENTVQNVEKIKASQ